MTAKKKHPLHKDVTTVENFKKVFSTPEGKSVLYDILTQGYFMSGTGAGETAKLNEGRRELCLYILQKLNTDVNDILQLIEDETKKEMEYGFNDNTATM